MTRLHVADLCKLMQKRCFLALLMPREQSFLLQLEQLCPLQPGVMERLHDRSLAQVGVCCPNPALPVSTTADVQVQPQQAAQYRLVCKMMQFWWFLALPMSRRHHFLLSHNSSVICGMVLLHGRLAHSRRDAR